LYRQAAADCQTRAPPLALVFHGSRLRLAPYWLSGPGPKHAIRQLLHVLAGLVIIDHPSPLQRAPGPARVWHRRQHALVIIAGVLAVIGHRDQPSPLALNLAADILQPRVSLRSEGALTRLRHVAQRHGPETLPTAVSHRDGRRGALLPSLMAQGNPDAVTTDRERGAIPPCGRPRLVKPVHHVRDLSAVAGLGHASAPTREPFAQRGA
jgi:hypothetical protein